MKIARASSIRTACRSEHLSHHPMAAEAAGRHWSAAAQCPKLNITWAKACRMPALLVLGRQNECSSCFFRVCGRSCPPVSSFPCCSPMRCLLRQLRHSRSLLLLLALSRVFMLWLPISTGIKAAHWRACWIGAKLGGMCTAAASRLPPGQLVRALVACPCGGWCIDRTCRRYLKVARRHGASQSHLQGHCGCQQKGEAAASLVGSMRRGAEISAFQPRWP